MPKRKCPEKPDADVPDAETPLTPAETEDQAQTFFAELERNGLLPRGVSADGAAAAVFCTLTSRVTAAMRGTSPNRCHRCSAACSSAARDTARSLRRSSTGESSQDASARICEYRRLAPSASRMSCSQRRARVCRKNRSTTWRASCLRTSGSSGGPRHQRLTHAPPEPEVRNTVNGPVVHLRDLTSRRRLRRLTAAERVRCCSLADGLRALAQASSSPSMSEDALPCATTTTIF